MKPDKSGAKSSGRSLSTAVFRIISSSVFLICLLSSAEAFRVQALPRAVDPGDTFLVKITGLKPLYPPEASFGGRKLFFDSCGEGCFFAVAATDTNIRPGRHAVRVNAGRKKKRGRVIVRRRSFATVQLTLPSEKVELSKEDSERADRESELLKSFWDIGTERVMDGSFVHPLDNEISTGYGLRRVFNGTRESIHRGIDIRGREGEEVRAANSGRVVLAEDLFFGGNTLVVDHGMAVYTVYMHLSGFNLKPGDAVEKGDVIGFVGSTGRSTGPHLHFGAKVQGLSVNPLSLMKLKL